VLDPAAFTTRTEVPLLIGFLDLAGFAKQAALVDDADLAATIDGWYEEVAARIAAAGGHVIKFIGDCAMVGFADADADRGVATVLDLKEEGDRRFAARGWSCRVDAKLHVGPVIAGPYGAAGAKRFDVIGKAVNDTARLPYQGVAVSPALEARLAPATLARLRAVTAS
jgi:class 3 adenylate cyclase